MQRCRPTLTDRIDSSSPSPLACWPRSRWPVTCQTVGTNLQNLHRVYLQKLLLTVCRITISDPCGRAVLSGNLNAESRWTGSQKIHPC
jgi:hypothetical protein